MPKLNIGQGDKGKTHLLGGKIESEKVWKDSAQIEACGALDELVSFIGYMRAYTDKKHKDIDVILEQIQDYLFRIESHISANREWQKHPMLPYVGPSLVDFLKKTMDYYEKDLPLLENFILPSGAKLATLMHVGRTEARRVERKLVALAQKQDINECAVPYLNRLSDVFFTLARVVNKRENAVETIWRGRDKNRP